jgi:hypothetical protein
MALICCRAGSGERVVEHLLNCLWETSTLMSGMRTTGFVSPLTINGPVKGVLLLAWVERH